MLSGNKRSIAGALAAAALFGASTPAAKAIGGDMHPLMLAGLLYSGSGVGLTLWMLVRRLTGGSVGLGIARPEYPWFAGAVIAGGVVAPALLMLGLASTQASVASLLLNLESVLTALIAWFVFRENFDRRIALGMLLIAAGGVILSTAPGTGMRLEPAALLIVGACLGWAIDNNLTRKVSGGDPLAIAAVKGWVAGIANLSMGWLAGAAFPTLGAAGAALVVGFAGYGLSLVLFVVALRDLGAARTGAYFSTAPFVGVALAIAVLGESAGPPLWVAGALMGWGVWLHVSERHVHTHTHEPLEHEHSHAHDEHHRHEHGFAWDGHEPHTHRHRHVRLTHRHPHFPDIHHRHRH